MRNLGARSSSIARLALTMLLVSCASYGPYHANTADKPLNSVRGPADGRYKMAFIEFGDQGSALDESQRAAALSVIHQSERPLHSALSEREFQIFRKLAAGTGVSGIAAELNLSVKTISTYRTRVMEKMQLKTNADIIRYAVHQRLVD